ncbi:MAG: sulfotransferase [Flavobacteriales bacterium]|nr:sulfotransferase [Flavobacteriales bacterium]
MKIESPIIIIGMHRSGTTMLTKLLEKFGLFVGHKKRKNYEATFFQKLNKWLLYQANVTWDSTGNIAYVDEDFLQSVSEVAKKRLSSVFRMEFLGPKKLINNTSISELTFKWGWKDPVNSITIDVWKNIFPKAKIIYVYRNPIDVAQSLKVREEKRRKDRKLGMKQRIKQKLLFRDYQFNQSYLINDFSKGIDLWKEYVNLNEKTLEKYPNDIIKIKYEDLLENPSGKLAEIIDFCELIVSKSEIEKVSSMIDSSRRYGFVNNPELCNHYLTIKQDPLMTKLGYDNIPI